MSAVVKSMRVPFLVLSPIAVGLGIAVALAYAHTQVKEISLLNALLSMLGAVAAHISVNAFNEYHDYRSGLDQLTEKTPFSGGSGGLVSEPEQLRNVLFLALSTLALVMVLGVYFVLTTGWPIAMIGLLGVILVLAYTPYINRFAWLCLFAPGLAFGPLMVLGTEYVVSGSISLIGVLASCPLFFLACNLLLLNQFPDKDADASVGRCHLVIRYGMEMGIRVYQCNLVAAGVSIIVLSFYVQNERVVFALIALLPECWAAIRLREACGSLASLLPLMGLNVVSTLLTPAALSAVLLISG